MKSVRLLSLLVVGALFGALVHASLANRVAPVAPPPPKLDVIGRHRGAIVADWEGVNLDGFRFAFRGPHQVELRFQPGDFEYTDWPPQAGKKGVVFSGIWFGRDYAVKIRPWRGDFQIHFPHERAAGGSWAEVYEIDLGWLPRLPEFLELLVAHREVLLVMAGSARAREPENPIEIESIGCSFDY